MPAPVSTLRQTPVGIKMDDGFSTKIAFNRDPDLSIWEKTVTPPGLDGGDAIETTTMHNLIYRTMSPKKLKTMTDCTGTCAYDPQVFTQMVELINQEGSVTIHFPDASKLDFFGYLKSFEPQENTEGEQPLANYTIVCTNQDLTGTEQSPVLTSVAGT